MFLDIHTWVWNSSCLQCISHNFHKSFQVGGRVSGWARRPVDEELVALMLGAGRGTETPAATPGLDVGGKAGCTENSHQVSRNSWPRVTCWLYMSCFGSCSHVTFLYTKWFEHLPNVVETSGGHVAATLTRRPVERRRLNGHHAQCTTWPQPKLQSSAKADGPKVWRTESPNLKRDKYWLKHAAIMKQGSLKEASKKQHTTKKSPAEIFPCCLTIAPKGCTGRTSIFMELLSAKPVRIPRNYFAHSRTNSYFRIIRCGNMEIFHPAVPTR